MRAIFSSGLLPAAGRFEGHFALFEDNRIGFVEGFNGYQLKMIQEVVTLTIFCVFAVLYLKEPLRWNYLASFACILGAVYFMFKA